MSGDIPRYYGLSRGTVVNNLDPLQQGRIQAIVTDVGGETPSSWAMPCMPMTGTQAGFYTVPPIGAGVWLMFEQGDPDRPVWMGGWWGSAAEVPAQALAGNPASPSILLQTLGQNVLAISDLPGPAGGIMLRSGTAMILVNAAGITITNGQGATVMLAGPTVTINNGALVVA
ncbi:phage baseplate assembly protein V [Dyella sp. BiH032]|uniref:phage baseplate assembly protein V n=1 Tax=Dyella sp. BiH032 TaxID=3075430 RepID=UPI0028931615|nr:phage baseplate assembly protein V [Dyella sp. BiH032]WNL45687.1 phage baseplate assembly protein V [Dyella sp. BiH032]